MYMKTMRTLAALSLCGEAFRCFSWQDINGSSFSFSSPMSQEAMEVFLLYNPKFHYDGVLEEVIPTDVVG